MTFSAVTVDTICLGLFALSGIIGLFRGFTKELLSLCSWFLSISLTYIFHDHFIHLALAYIKNPFIAKSIVSIIMFMSIYICMSIIVYLIVSLIKDSILSGIDRTLGFFYGFCRGYIILVFIHQAAYLFFSNTIFSNEFRKSFFYDYIENGSNYLNQVLPNQVKTYFDRSDSSLKDLDLKKHLDSNKAISSMEKIGKQLLNTQSSVDRLLENRNISEVEKFAKLKPKIDSSESENGVGISKEQQRALGKFFAASKNTDITSSENIEEQEISSQLQPSQQQPSNANDIDVALDKLF